MPQYFFHTADDGRGSDVEGVDLPDHATARVEAIRYGGDLLQDRSPDNLWDGGELRVSVTDGDGRLLVTVIMLAIDTPEMDKAKA